MSGLLILAASPRGNGTTARAADMALREARSLGLDPLCLSLAGLRLPGCDHCGICRNAPHACRLAEEDDTERVLSALQAAERVLWISPVYFYGLPSRAKALADRGQRFYEREAAAGPVRRTLAPPAPGQAAPAAALFLAGRTRGASLFTGSALTVRAFFACLGVSPVRCLGLRGAEGPGDLTGPAAAALARFFRGFCAGDQDPPPDRLEEI